jgi:hypothetical protein
MKHFKALRSKLACFTLKSPCLMKVLHAHPDVNNNQVDYTMNTQHIVEYT